MIFNIPPFDFLKVLQDKLEHRVQLVNQERLDLLVQLAKKVEPVNLAVRDP